MLNRKVKTIVLYGVNYQLHLPGFAQPILSKDLKFNADEGILFVAQEGMELPFYETDEINIQVRDLEIPTAMRNSFSDEGWLDTTMPAFIENLRLTLSE